MVKAQYKIVISNGDVFGIFDIMCIMQYHTISDLLQWNSPVLDRLSFIDTFMILLMT